MFDAHWSSCALFRGPAYVPRRCDCGRITGSKAFGLSSGHPLYSPAVALENELLLWIVRVSWLRENFAIFRSLFRLSGRLSKQVCRFCRIR